MTWLINGAICDVTTSDHFSLRMSHGVWSCTSVNVADVSAVNLT
jgi:hypothetical protein